MCLLDERLRVVYVAISVGVLDEGTAEVLPREVGLGRVPHLETDRRGWRTTKAGKY